MRLGKLKINGNRNLFLFGLMLMATGLPLSAFLMSLGQFVLLGNWILEAEWKEKWRKISSTRWPIFFFLFYILHLLGMLWSEDMDYGLKDLRIKLPLLWIPLLLFTSAPLSKKEIKSILLVFVSAVFISTLIGFVVYLGWTGKQVVDIRQISIFISHIRLSLMIVLSVFVLLLDTTELVKTENSLIKKLISVFFVFWFLFFLVLSEAITGISVLLICLLFFLFFRLIQKNSFRIKLGVFLLIFSLFSFFIWLFISEWNLFYSVPQAQLSSCEISENGRKYFSDSNSNERENGHLIWNCIQIEELKSEWNKRSTIAFDSIGRGGNQIASTLIRYLSSKGLRKDSLAVVGLSQEEIEWVENGVVNKEYTNPGSLRSRMHEIIWEYDKYNRGGDPAGHSLLMRIEFWKCALNVIKENLFFGVGTGDVKLEFDRNYEKTASKLPTEWRLRSHNQFLTTTAAFGMLGFVFLISLFIVPLFNFKDLNSLFVYFLIIVFLSMLNEDTLETQAGVTFFSFFYFIFYTIPFKKHKAGLEQNGKSI